ncbi:MAG: trimethylamine methyltransferase family protein, partial [candidate division Zixibacteria bacterium]
INNISGPGMIDFENCFSLEKLVIDNEICGSLLHMKRGIEPKEDFPAQPRMEELIAEQHLLISEHTQKYLTEEVYFPSAVIDRANRDRWKEEGSTTLNERANAEVERIIGEHEQIAVTSEMAADLTKLMTAEASRFGMDKLPQ